MGRKGTRGHVAMALVIGLMLLTSACGSQNRITRRSTQQHHAVEASLRTVHAMVSGTAWALIGLDFLTATEGFVIGSDCAAGTTRCTGAVGRTSDGGSTLSWVVLGKTDPLSVTFIDPLHGWVVALDAAGRYALLATTDGGRTWHSVYTSPTAMQVRFVSQSVGYAIISAKTQNDVLGETELLKTEDGGSSWLPLAVNGYMPDSVDFLNAQRGYITGWRCSGGSRGACAGAILGTSDGGATWNVLQQIGGASTANIGSFSLDFLSPQAGFAELPDLQGCTMGGCLPGLERTSDGGRTWQPLQPAYNWGKAIAPGWTGGVAFQDNTTGFVGFSPGAGVGAAGFAVTQDGGRTWTQYGANTIQLGSMSVTQGAVYAISTLRTPFTSSGAAIVRLGVDGSVQQIWPAPVPTMGIGSVGDGLLYGFGLPTSPTALLQSTDGGRTWHVTGELPGTSPNAVSFVSSSDGYAVSSTYSPSVTLPVQMYQTSDGGRNWTSVGQRLAQPNTYLRFFGGGVGVRVDYEPVGGIILHTTDGGETWTLGANLPYASVTALSFSSPEDGVAYSGTNTSATLFATTDGGRKWTTILKPPASTTPNVAGTVMDFPSPATGLVQLYAQSGQYALTGDGGRSWTEIDLPGIGPAIGVAVDDASTALLLTTSGLYRTQDGGKVWTYVP